MKSINKDKLSENEISKPQNNEVTDRKKGEGERTRKKRKKERMKERERQ